VQAKSSGFFGGGVTADARSVSGKHALLGPVTLNLAAVRSLSWERPPGGARTVKR
jgi:hypothetical protein